MTEQTLRQAKNEVKISGKVAEVDLAVKDFIDKITKQPYKAIMGRVTIKINEEESHAVSYFIKEFTKTGAKNKSYLGLQTFMDKTVSIADIASGLAPEGSSPSIVAVNNAQVGLNEYKAADGNIISNLQLSATFPPSEVKNLENFEPTAEFDIEGIVKSVSLETKKDDDGVEEETGRAKINLYVPLYGGAVIPLTLVTDTELGAEGADYATETFTPKTSVNLWGNFVNKSKEIRRKKEGGFGSSKDEVTFVRVRELSVTGGMAYEEDVHTKQIFDVKLLKEALANRERKLATIKEAEAPAPAAKKPNGFSASNTVPKNTNTQTKEQDAELDSLFDD